MKTKYLGWEFRNAIATAAHKICADLSLRPVTVTWHQGITTAGINHHGNIYLSNVRDDAVMTQVDLMQYTGYIVHELLHRKYTDFNFVDGNQYIDQLTNALEDARIEHLAIDKQLTGNVTVLLTTLIDGMVNKALIEVTDWADPAQYPFVLAVYTRKHAATKIPLADDLAPIFDQAVIQLEQCANSGEVLSLARWVYSRLQLLTPPKGAPKPRKAPASPSKEGGEGKGAGEGDRASDKAGKAGSPGKATAPRGSTAVEVEPTTDCGVERGSGGFYCGSVIAKPLHHVKITSPRFIINF